MAEYPPSRIALGPPGPTSPSVLQAPQSPLRQGDAVWGGEEALHGLAVAGNLQDHHLVACELSLVEAPRLPTGDRGTWGTWGLGKCNPYVVGKKVEKLWKSHEIMKQNGKKVD